MSWGLGACVTATILVRVMRHCHIPRLCVTSLGWLVTGVVALTCLFLVGLHDEYLGVSGQRIVMGERGPVDILEERGHRTVAPVPQKIRLILPFLRQLYKLEVLNSSEAVRHSYHSKLTKDRPQRGIKTVSRMHGWGKTGTKMSSINER